LDEKTVETSNGNEKSHFSWNSRFRDLLALLYRVIYSYRVSKSGYSSVSLWEHVSGVSRGDTADWVTGVEHMGRLPYYDKQRHQRIVITKIYKDLCQRLKWLAKNR
jgi:hypothetical protein